MMIDFRVSPRSPLLRRELPSCCFSGALSRPGSSGCCERVCQNCRDDCWMTHCGGIRRLGPALMIFIGSRSIRHKRMLVLAGPSHQLDDETQRSTEGIEPAELHWLSYLDGGGNSSFAADLCR